MIRFTILLIVIPAWFSALHAQDQEVTVHGAIMDKETEAPVNARVNYRSLPYGNIVGILRGSEFIFPFNQKEGYLLNVEAEGYLPVSLKVSPEMANEEYVIISKILLVASQVGRLIRLESLIFEQGRSGISPDSYQELDMIVEMMQDNPNMGIQLEGHTDYSGSASQNMKLSEKRVASIKKYLRKKGISKNRIQTKAYGGTQPLERGTDLDVRRVNRRVEVRILSN